MADDALSSLARWHAVVHYRTDAELVDVEMHLHEIGDLHERIELGPHWDTIKRITIMPINHDDSPTLTLSYVVSTSGAQAIFSSPPIAAQSALADDALSSSARWRAIAYYRGDVGPIDIEMFLDEIADLHDRIERGPHFLTIERIVIERINHVDSPTLTIEQASKL
jgi:hypothetical protein